MKRLIKTSLFLLGLFAASTCFAQVKQDLSDAELAQIVQDAVVPMMSQHNVPGIAVGVYYNGQPHYYNFGVASLKTNAPVTKDTIFELASISKIFASTLLAVEVEQGKININDPISNYLPALKANPSAPINQVTVKELATHTSSLPRMPSDVGVNNDTGTNGMLMKGLDQWQPDHPIGTNYLYSNLGFGLLGNVLQSAGHGNYDNLVETNVFQPLGMTNSYANFPPPGLSNYAQGYKPNGQPSKRYPYSIWPAGGAARSTSADMMKFMEAYLGVGNAPAYILKAAQLALQPEYQVNPKFSLGLGWERTMRHGTLFITKNGLNIGFNSFMMMIPQQKIAVVVLANKRAPATPTIGKNIIQSILKMDNTQNNNQDNIDTPNQDAAE